MGFSQSKNPLERVRAVYDIVLKLEEGKSMDIPSNTPVRLAYAIFEGYKVCERLKPDNPDRKYLELKNKYIIRNKGDRVIFEPRIKVDVGTPVERLQEKKIKVSTMNELTTVFEIVGACIKHKNNMVFPNASLDDNSLIALTKWCGQNDYLIDKDEPLTLMKNAPRPEDGTV